MCVLDSVKRLEDFLLGAICIQVELEASPKVKGDQADADFVLRYVEMLYDALEEIFHLLIIVWPYAAGGVHQQHDIGAIGADLFCGWKQIEDVLNE